MNKIFTVLFMLVPVLLVKAQFTDNGSYSTTNDNIGIGVSDPTEKLEIAGKIKMYGQPVPKWNNSISSYVLQSSHFYGHTDTEQMYVGEAGNLVNLRGKLKVNNLTIGKYGGAISGNANPYVIFSDPSAGDQDLLLYGNHDAILNLRLFDGSIKLGSSATANAIINNNGSASFLGNVGIGTANPGSFKLAVEGKIGAREIQVTAVTPWPDYVFEEDYNLTDLSEVEQYIKENKHLPGVPTTTEVEKDGVNLGEMNVKLLEKVEELTLYVIEQNKQLKDQSQLIQSMQSEIENLRSIIR